DASRARFDAAVAAAQRLRNSAVAEGLLIALVYVVGLLVWPHYGELNVATWYAVPARGGRELSPAGWWFVYVSLPLFQFILSRWWEARTSSPWRTSGTASSSSGACVWCPSRGMRSSSSP